MDPEIKPMLHITGRKVNDHMYVALCGKKVFPHVASDMYSDEVVAINLGWDLVAYCETNPRFELATSGYEPCMKCHDHPMKDLHWLADTELE